MTDDEMTWRPIETAPRDGTRVLLSDGINDADIGFYVAEHLRWFSQSDEYNRWAVSPPTHWQPLPAPSEPTP